MISHALARIARLVSCLPVACLLASCAAPPQPPETSTPATDVAATVAAQATTIAGLQVVPTPDARVPALSTTVAAQATEVAALAGQLAEASPLADLARLNRSAAERGRSATVLIELRDSGGAVFGLGSGIVVDAAGLILTNWHVAGNVPALTIDRGGQTRLPARLVESDPDLDLAILQVDDANLTPAVLGSAADLASGDTVLTVGYGLGDELGTEAPTVTSGIVSARRAFPIGARRIEHPLIQITAAVNEGNSGGPLLNQQGEVVGIVTKGGNPAKVQSVNFALPIDDALPLIEAARARTAKPGAVATPAVTSDVLSATLRRFYEAVDRRDFEAAARLWPANDSMPDRTSRLAQDFNGVERVYLDEFRLVAVGDGTATVEVETTAVSRVPAGRLAQRARVTWRLTDGGGGWRLASATDALVGAAQPLTNPADRPRRGSVASEFYQRFLMSREQIAQELFDEDVTGDIGVETLIVARPTGCSDCPDRTLYVFQGKTLLYSTPADTPRVQALPSRDGFEVTEPIRRAGEPTCCPTRSRTRAFHWDGTTFRPAG